jgi:hypothetical protein
LFADFLCQFSSSAPQLGYFNLQVGDGDRIPLVLCIAAEGGERFALQL